MPGFFLFWHFGGHLYLYNITLDRHVTRLQNVSGNQAVGQHQDKSTRTSTAQKQKTSFFGQFTAQK